MIAKLIKSRLIYADSNKGCIQLEDMYGHTIDLILDASTAFPLDVLSLVGEDVEVVCVDDDKFRDVYPSRGYE